jgi:hypothetical protein
MLMFKIRRDPCTIIYNTTIPPVTPTTTRSLIVANKDEYEYEMLNLRERTTGRWPHVRRWSAVRLNLVPLIVLLSNSTFHIHAATYFGPIVWSRSVMVVSP